MCDLAGRGASSDPLVGRESVVAMELIGEVFSVGGDEVKRMIKERMERKGMIRDRRKDLPENAPEEIKMELKKAATRAKKSSKPSKRGKIRNPCQRKWRQSSINSEVRSLENRADFRSTHVKDHEQMRFEWGN